MANVTQQKLKELVATAPQGMTSDEVVRGLIARGHTIEGISPETIDRVRTEEKKTGVLNKAAEFLGIEKVGRRIGSELVRLTPEGRDLKKMLAQGKITQEQYDQIVTGGVSNKEAIGSGVLLGVNLAGGVVAGKLLGTATKAGSVAGAVQATKAAVPTLGAATKVGAAVGAVGGVGAGLEQNQDAGGVIESAALGAFIGAGIPLATKLVGMGIRGVGAATRAGIRGATRVGGAIAETAEQKIANATRARVAEQAGRIGEAQSIRSGIDPQVVDFIQTAQGADRSAFKRMYDIAAAKKGDIRIQTQPKEIVGNTILDRVNYLVGANKKAGEAIGKAVTNMGSKKVDITNQYVETLKLLKANGVGVKNGKVYAVGRVADGDLPQYQKMLDYIMPDKDGKVLRTPQYIHERRGLIFDELNLAKQRQQPYTDTVTKVAEKYRTILMQPLEAINPEYKAQSIAFANTRKPIADFAKIIGYKGRLEDISGKTLRTAEVAQRVLGNAADRPMTVLTDLENAAINYGYKPKTSVFDQILFSDLLENYFGTTQTRSLRGQISRAGVDTATEMVGATADAARGNIFGLINKAIRFTTGHSDEQQLKALGQLLKDETRGDIVKTLPRTAPKGGGSAIYTQMVGEDAAQGLRNVPDFLRKK